MTSRFLVTTAVVVALLAPAPVLHAAGPKDRYTSALGRERALRNAERPPTLTQIRAVIAAYERVVGSYPRSGYSDNALWQAANLSLLAYERFGQATDRRRGLDLLARLKSQYPSSSLVARVRETAAAFDRAADARASAAAAAADAARAARSRPKAETATRAATASARPPAAVPASRTAEPVTPLDPAKLRKARTPISRVGVDPGTDAKASEDSNSDLVTIRAVSRALLPDGLRVSIEMDGEALYHQERLTDPDRLFFDFKGTDSVEVLQDAVLKYAGTPVPEIRLGRHPDHTTRVVMEMEGVESFSVFTLYNPYRVVVDFRRAGAPAAPLALTPAPVPAVAHASFEPADTDAPAPVVSAVGTGGPAAPEPAAATANPLPSRDLSRPAPAVPSVPVANSNGQFSIARQLGLGVARIVIDAGHGGHDPGAHGSGINEAELVLDVAQRLRKLLQASPGVEVVMTRDSDVFIPLEERTAIANREGADLFLSIHANASRNTKAHGVETYFLNFASNPEAEAVAARENSASGRTMHSLPEIVRAIALNNKIDESRDFAEMVQKSMVKRLKPSNAELRDLGVKQAPFVVLIGASMPSVLAEISFVTHKQEGQLLKTPAYRQSIAQALYEAVQEYQQSLKVRNAIASR